MATLIMSLSAVQTANAALVAVSPNPARINGVAVGGMPSWYQDANGVSVQPCLDLANCGLAADVGFNPALAVAFPGNFPPEAFYFNASTSDMIIGGATVSVINALEFTTVAPGGAVGVIATTPGVVTAPFQRLRLIVKPPDKLTSVAVGTWTINTPWGAATFDTNLDCPRLGPGITCRMTRDLPLPGAIPPDFVAPLGTGFPGTISTFLKAVPPPAVSGFLGLGAAAAAFTGAPAGGANSFTVTDPAGTRGTTTALAILIGNFIGMDVQPGINHDMGQTIIAAVSAPKTITITNATGNPILFPALVTAGADAAGFTIAASVTAGAAPFCSGATVAPLASCSFDIAFTPPALAKASRVATIALTPTTVQPVPAPATPIDNPPPITMNLTGTALVKITAVAASEHGTISQDSTAILTPAGTAPAGTAVAFTAIPTSKKFKLKSVDDNGVLLGTPATPATLPNVPPFTFNSGDGATAHTVTATFMSSGDLDADGTLGIADALKALKIVAGVQAADTDDPDNSAVKVAPLVSGVPSPLNSKISPDIGDVLVILRKVLDLDKW
jgi:hypothetical protein